MLYKEAISGISETELLEQLGQGDIKDAVTTALRNIDYLRVYPVLKNRARDSKDTSFDMAGSRAAVDKILQLVKANSDPSFHKTIGLDKLTASDLKAAGFEESYVAIPENGQKGLRTWRHPITGMHIHEHPDKWVYHIDTYPSMAMTNSTINLLRRSGARQIKPYQDAAKVHSIGLEHVLKEGVPAAVNITSDVLTGDADAMLKNRFGTAGQVARTAIGLLAGAAMVSGVSRGVTQFTGSKDWNVPESFVAAATLVAANKGLNRLYSDMNESTVSEPSWNKALVTGFLPIGAAAGAYAAVNRLRSKMKQKAKERDVTKRKKVSRGAQGTLTPAPVPA